ncbi:MAG: histidine--tRNA ligase [Planctomycetota bacterium]|nr:MAG: histidine--tRNA ligase [Planctomycetota bacterium]
MPRAGLVVSSCAMKWQRLPGFRDFYPDDMARRRAIERAWHDAAQAAGFSEFDGPVLEPLELYTAKSGEEIVRQLYAFEDQGGRRVAMRPEMTPTLARMVAARAGALPKPLKWYCVQQFFRYERPQRGRGREFFQWNVDVVGSSEPAADAEAIFVALDGLARLGVGPEHVELRVSDRRVLSRLLDHLEVAAAQRSEVLHWLDKIERDRRARPELQRLLGESAAAQLFAWCEHYPREQAPELEPILTACADFGLEPYVRLDLRVVRGLAYYTGPVWEIFARDLALRAVAGGGRYDELVSTLGGPSLPALGFGMGDMVLAELLAALDREPPVPPAVDTVVIPIGDAMAPIARQLVARLRRQGTATEMPFGRARLGKALKAASRRGARRAVLVGGDEWAEGKVRIKELETGREESVPLEAL